MISDMRVNHKKRIRIAAIINTALFVCLIFSGCFDTVEDLAASEPDMFENIEYERIDCDATASEINSCIDAVASADDYSSVKAIADYVEELTDDFSFMTTIACINTSMNRNDEYWAGENDYYDAGYPSVSTAYQKFILTVYKSEYRDRLISEMPDGYFDGVYDLDDETYDRIEKISAVINGLVTDYSKTIVSGTIEWEASYYTLDQIYELEGDEYYNANEKWFDKYNPELGEKYIELVKYRNELAGLYGYGNYIDYCYDTLLDNQYSYDEAVDYLDNVKKYLVPVLKAMEQDNIVMFNNGLSDDHETVFSVLWNILESMDSNMSYVYEKIFAYGYIDYEKRDGKDAGAYSTYLNRENMPFLFMTYEDDVSSLITASHEFGHCYQSYVTEDRYNLTLDTLEIHSLAMQLLVSHFFDDYYYEQDAWMMKFDSMTDVFKDNIVMSAGETAFEYEVYSSDDELTVDWLNSIYSDCMSSYGVDISSDREWILTSHFYEVPFYMLSYSIAGCVAVQIDEIADNDTAEAVSVYNSIVYCTGGTDFRDNIISAGLETPFNEDTVKKAGEWAEEKLILDYYDYMDDSAA